MSGLQPGRRYKITNVKNPDCVLDLSGADNSSIIGYAYHGGDNQKWELERNSDGWHLRNVASGNYAVIHSDENGTKVVADPNPYLWHIWDDNGAYRVSVPNVPKSLDLSNHGAGPDVEVWGRWKGTNQLWRFEEVLDDPKRSFLPTGSLIDMRYVRDLQVGRYYKLVSVLNQQRILDLSGPYGGSTVTGFMSYGGNNQKWELQGDCRGFTLRNAHNDLYLAFKGHDLSKDDYPRGTKAIGSPRPFLWNIQKRNEDQMNSNFQEPARFRLSTSGLKKHLDLDYYTHSKVHLIEDTGHQAQLWYFEEVADVNYARPVMDPGVSLNQLKWQALGSIIPGPLNS